MADTDQRAWQEIAAEMANERDDQKLIRLCRELDAALLKREQGKVLQKLQFRTRGQGVA